MRMRWAAVAAAVLIAGLGAALGIRAATAGAVHHAGPGTPPGATAIDGTPLPAGGDGHWRLAFADEFDGPSLDRSKWTDASSAEADDGHGNRDNQQLEWNSAGNCLVSGGELAMTARRQAFTSPSGTGYDWTSCLLSSAPSYAFRYGFVEERAILPAQQGFWPAFWTWQAPDVDAHVETDVYEFYSSDRRQLYLTQHSGREKTCRWRPGFDPTAGWHTYGAAIEESGTTWYVDGVEVCHTDATSDAMTNIVSNLAVHAEDPPTGGVTTAVKRVDYIRAWQRP